MPKKVASFRLDVDLLEWLGSYAKSRGATQAAVLEGALAAFRRECEGGVPDLPVPDSPVVRRQRAQVAAAGQVAPASDFLPGEYAKLMGERQRRLNAAKDRARAKS
jgi:hypothetical protein